MRIANTAALVLAMASLMATAQRSGGRVDRKPSPATPATGTQAAPATQSATSPYRSNSGSSTPIAPQATMPRPVAVAPAPLARPLPAIPAQPVAPQPAPVSVAAAVPVPVTQPVASPVPPPEPVVTVNYAQGQLSVVSQNASLGTVLKLISAKTGAFIDLAPELQNEPVAAQIGPSAVRDVMTALLDSPKIDYIILGSAANDGLGRVLVRTRHSFGRTEFAGSRPFQPPQQQPETEFKINENVPPVAGMAKPQTPLTPLTQEQLMANWQKAREEKRLAEIVQQRVDRENEANRVEPPPPPEPQPNNNADNPPLN